MKNFFQSKLFWNKKFHLLHIQESVTWALPDSVNKQTNHETSWPAGARSRKKLTIRWWTSTQTTLEQEQCRILPAILVVFIVYWEINISKYINDPKSDWKTETRLSVCGLHSWIGNIVIKILWHIFRCFWSSWQWYHLTIIIKYWTNLIFVLKWRLNLVIANVTVKVNNMAVYGRH